MKKQSNILILTFLITTLSLCSQNTKMVFHYKNGKEVSGLGKLRSEKKIKFKATKKGKKQILSYQDLKDVDYIESYEQDNIVIYQFVHLKEKKVKLLERTAKGKINLYRRVRIMNNPGMQWGGTAPFGGPPVMVGGYSYTMKNFYVQRENEKIATHLGSNQLFTKNFKKAITNFVKDCPTLVSKIKNKEYKKKHLREIVEYYNNKCN